MRHCEMLDNPFAKRGAVCAMGKALYCDCDCPDCDPSAIEDNADGSGLCSGCWSQLDHGAPEPVKA